MKCPACNQDLVMSDRQGIEIDYCSKCRGVWLDRGELDKIIERSMRDALPPVSQQPAPQAQPYRDERQYQQRDHDDYRRHKHYKQKSWLSEIFD